MQPLNFSLNVYISDEGAEKLAEFLKLFKPTSNEVVVNDDELLTTDEVMAEFKLSTSVLARYRTAGLPYVKSRPNKYKRSDVQNFINRKIISR
jgi:hypothetical protein